MRRLARAMGMMAMGWALGACASLEKTEGEPINPEHQEEMMRCAGSANPAGKSMSPKIYEAYVNCVLELDRRRREQKSVMDKKQQVQ